MGKCHFKPRQAACANRPRAFWAEPLQSSNSKCRAPARHFELEPFRATIFHAIRNHIVNEFTSFLFCVELFHPHPSSIVRRKNVRRKSRASKKLCVEKKCVEKRCVEQVMRRTSYASKKRASKQRASKKSCVETTMRRKQVRRQKTASRTKCVEIVPAPFSATMTQRVERNSSSNTRRASCCT